MGMAGAKGLLLAGYMLSGVFCSGSMVKMPKRIEALRGSCVLIPCTLDVSEQDADQLTISTFGVWIKHIPQFARPESTVVFNSSTTHNILSGKIGDLVQKNCTTVLDNIPKDYSDDYYFRIENLDFKKTFPNTPVYIDVQDSPHKPKITKLNELTDGTPADLKCTAAAPCITDPPILTWTPYLGNTRLELLADSEKIESLSSLLTFTPSHLDHGKNITCSAEYMRQNGMKIKVEDNMTLQVLFSPKNTMASISPSGPLLNGSSVTLTCNSWANPPVSDFTWFRVTSIPTARGSGQTLTFKVSSGDVGWYYCEARNQQGKHKSKQVKLTVEGVQESVPLSVIGGIVGTLGVLLACSLPLIFWRMRKSRESCISRTMTSTEGQSNPSFSKADKTREPTAVLESQQEEIQYAEIKFSKRQAKEKVKRTKEDRQDTEYAEVQFSERKGKAQIEDIYTKV